MNALLTYCHTFDQNPFISSRNIQVYSEITAELIKRYTMSYTLCLLICSVLQRVDT